MATRSAAKAHRQSLRRRLRNRSVTSTARTSVKKAEGAIAASDSAGVTAALRYAISALDRAAKKGVLHPNNTARRKSRLMAKYKTALAQVAPEPSPAEETPKPRARRKRSE